MQSEPSRRKAGYLATALGVIGVGMMAATTTAEAATVGKLSDTMKVQEVSLSALAPFGRFQFDLNGDKVNDFEVFVNAARLDGGAINEIGVVGSAGYGKDSPTRPWISGRLSAGDIVDQTTDFVNFVVVYDDSGTNKNIPGVQIVDDLEVGETAYYGLKLEFLNEPLNHFGWVEVTRGSLTVTGIGFQTAPGAGAPIPASLTAVPVPASLPLLAAGIGGIALLRRRKKAAAAG